MPDKPLGLQRAQRYTHPMRDRVSAGLVVFRRRGGELEVFLAHPGGPFFTHKDDGHWTIPKGEVESDEELLAAALREFHEEIGIALSSGSEFLPLGCIQQKGGKWVHAWAVEQDWDEQPIRSNEFEMEWPPGSGRVQRFFEVDRAQFFPLAVAKRKIKERQLPLLDELERAVSQ
jgi:predicted NUDIX family NTP pyrophosphohydrolase